MSDRTHSHIAAAAVAAITASMTKVIGGETFTVDVATLPDSSIAYLAEYGYAQSMGDTKALSALEKAKAAEKAGVLPEGFTKDLTTQNAAKAVSDHNAATGNGDAFDKWEAGFLAERARARFDAILAGDMVFGSAERLSPEDKDRRAICQDMLKNALSAAGKKMPKGDELQAMLDWVYEQRKAEIDKSVAARAKERAKHGALDLSAFPG